MKELLLPKLATDKTIHLALSETIRRVIQDGILNPGELLPSTRQLANHYSINRHTVMKSLKDLEAEGWLVSEEKKFYQVAPEIPTTFLLAKSVLQSSFPKKKIQIVPAKSFNLSFWAPNQTYRYRFPSGLGDVREFPYQEFKSHFYDATKNKYNFEYGDPSGHGPLKEQIADFLRRTRKIKDRSIIVTNGSQEALFLLGQLLIRPGDNIAVECKGYPPAFSAFQCAGANLCPVEIDEQGIKIESLEQVITKKKPRFLYCTPLHQYPTTVTMSVSRRFELIELAYKYSLPIIEDDYDHEFHYESSPLAPLASSDPGELVLYVSTFSKVLFPSIRLGFVALPHDLLRPFSDLKRISSRQNETLFQDTVARWMTSGGFEKHLRKMRQLYQFRRDCFIETLEKEKQRHPQLSWSIPSGGMAIWLNTWQDSHLLAQKAHDKKILVAPESHYSLSKKIGTHLRLGFTAQNEKENSLGLGRLFSLL